MSDLTCCSLNDFLHAMSDETREGLLNLLRDREMSVNELTEHFALTQPTISHHLGILRRACLVTTRRDGRQVFYRANPDCIVRGCCEIQTLFHLCVSMKVSQRGKR